MRKIILGLSAAVLTFALSAGNVFCQEEEYVEEMGDFAFGEVVSVAADKIVILDYDLEKDMEVEVAFVINTETEYENVESIADIKAGDEVSVTFEEKDGQKVALVIIKEEPWEMPTDDPAMDESPEEPADEGVEEPTRG